MKILFTGLILGSLSTPVAYAVQPSGVNWMVNEVVETVEEVIESVTIQEPKQQTQFWVSKGLSQNEQTALTFFQERGIVDKMALSVIMGNIKQESRFYPNICEGGARINYEHCHRGGYGLVQWTTSFRYWGLGNHAKQLGKSPSILETQLSYLVTEREWKKAEVMFKTPGQSLQYYMKAADIWLGWGIYGNRGYFSQQYYSNLTPVDTP